MRSRVDPKAGSSVDEDSAPTADSRARALGCHGTASLAFRPVQLVHSVPPCPPLLPPGETSACAEGCCFGRSRMRKQCCSDDDLLLHSCRWSVVLVEMRRLESAPRIECEPECACGRAWCRHGSRGRCGRERSTQRHRERRAASWRRRCREKRPAKGKGQLGEGPLCFFSYSPAGTTS